MHLNGGVEPAAVSGGTVFVATGAVVAANQTSNTGPILAFVGAILVALLTAYWANRRQAAALQAEQKRLDAQLEHERALGDVSDLREILESALREADSFRRLVAEIRAVGDDDSDEATRRRAKIAEGIAAGEKAAHHVTNQLQIRLEDGSPILVAYHALMHSALDQVHRRLEPQAAWGTAEAQVQAAYRAFVAAAKERVGTRIP